MSDGKLIAGLCLKVPLCSEDMSSLFSYTEKIRADGFQAGAASRDAEVAMWIERVNSWTRDCDRLADERDQLRADVAELNEHLETERIRLAACGVAALGYFYGCKDEYRSASLNDTLRLVEKNDQLRAQINALTSALNKIAERTSSDDHCRPLVQLAIDSLASTPEQSLAEYRNKVIEAFVNEFSRHVGGDGEFCLHKLQDFAMKEQP